MAIAAALLLGAFWYGHSKGWNSRDASAKAEISALETQYQQASDKAVADAKVQQQRADELSVQQAQQQAAAAQQAADKAAGIAADATARVQAIQAKLNEASQHDATVDAWRKQRIPAGVRSVLAGSG